MRVCFAGYGSIAKRHISNLKELYGKECHIDLLRHSKGDTAGLQFVDRIFYDWNELESDYDAFFITNPTTKHFDTLKETVKYCKKVFVEKPVFDTSSRPISSLGLDENGVYYVACPLRYTGMIKYLKDNIDFDGIYSLRAISSSYLPDWRVTDYRQSYSARKELGGGVSLDLVHEWDYISYLIGFPAHVSSIISKKSDLQIDTDDIAVYIAEYENKVVEIHLDYFGRKPVRLLEMYGKDDTIIADFIRSRITWLKSGKELIFEESRDDYQKRELEHFFDITEGKEKNDSDIGHAMKVLRLAEGEWN